MRFLVTILLLLCLGIVLKAQNLVPNPSFEDTVYCPFGTNQIDAAVNWMSFGNSPDYFNACAPAYLNVPNSEFGFQYAHTGVAMAGVVTYRNPISPDGANYREFIGAPLLFALQPEVKYYMSFFVNFAAGPSVAVATNKIGCRFSTNFYSEFNLPLLNNYSNLHTDLILIDSVQWYKLSGFFISDSSYSFLIIGNFFEDSLTDTLNVGQFPDYSYYYIDDVCVTTDSIFNESWTSLSEISDRRNHVVIYPNPTSNWITINSSENIEEVAVLNSVGQMINTTKKKLSESRYWLSLQNANEGVYFIKIKTENSSVIYLVNLIH